MYPKDLIETIRSRVNVVRLIGEVVPLKRAGRNYVGLCPFHGEKSPSFSVSDEKQLYHCFGCGVGGSVYQFVMQYHQLAFKESVEKLAVIAGIDLSSFQSDPMYHQLREKKDQLFGLYDYIAEKFHAALTKSQLGAEAREYVKKRQLKAPTIEKWKIGFAPEGWDHLVNALQRDGKSLEHALELGLIAKSRDKGFFDTFRNRVMFPIRDVSGHTVGFGGRAMGDIKPKYLNSSQSILFDKSKTLYGLFEAKEALRVQKNLLVVEGYMDLLALDQYGFSNAVATLGTALTLQHAELIRKHVEKVTLLFDGDMAGQKAAIRSLKPLLSQGLTVHVVFIPESQDPDEYLQKNGKESLEALISSAPTLLDFFIENFYLRAKDMAVKSRALETLAEVIKETPFVYVKEALVHEISSKAQVSAALLRGDSKEQTLKPVVKKTQPPKNKPSNASLIQVPQEFWMLLRMVSEISEANSRFNSELEKLKYLLSSDLIETTLIWLQETEGLKSQDHSVAAFVDLWPSPVEKPAFTKVFLEEFPSLHEKWDHIFDDCMKKLHDKKIKALTQEISLAEHSTNSDAIALLTQQIQQLKSIHVTKRVLGNKSGGKS